MIFHEVRSGGCVSYLFGCEATRAAALIDPELGQIDRTLAQLSSDGLRLHYVIDTHTHADHFSAAHALAQKLDVPVVMHRNSATPFADLRVEGGETLIVGELRAHVLHTPGHTADSMCVVVEDRIFTGDTLLRGGTGRTDLPTGDPEALYLSLFEGIFRLNPRLQVFPAHNYKGTPVSTLEQELASNPRLQKRDRAAFVEQMRSLDLSMPTHLTEALRTNSMGGKTVRQLISEAASQITFMDMDELLRRLERREEDLVVLDVREREAFDEAHIPGARHLARGQLELRVDALLPDPTVRIVTCCELGKISTLAAATLRTMGYRRVVALDGGFQGWRERSLPTESQRT